MPATGNATRTPRILRPVFQSPGQPHGPAGAELSRREPQQSDAAVARTKAVSRVPRKQLRCRTEHHKWPEIDLDKGSIPKNLTFYIQPGRIYQQVEVCSRCGATRWRETLPGGLYDVNSYYRRGYPPDWEKIPRDLEVTRTRLRQELWDESMPALIAASAASRKEPVQ